MQQKAFECRSIFIEAQKGSLENLNFSVAPGSIMVLLVPEATERINLLKVLLGNVGLQSGSLLLNGERVDTFSLSNRLEKGMLVLLTSEEGRGLVTDERILQENAIGYAKVRISDLWSLLPWMGERKSFSRFKRSHRLYRKGTHSPEILIATSYPAQHTDTESIQRQYLYSIMELKSRGTAVLLLTDTLEGHYAIADQIGMIRHGHLVALVNNEACIRQELKTWERQEHLGK